jgi:ribokinase
LLEFDVMLICLTCFPIENQPCSLTAYTPMIPKVGETIIGSSFQTNFGGKGANQAVQSARLGISTSLIATIGQDSYGHNYLKGLEIEGIDVHGIKQVEGSSTGIAVIWVDAAGMNSIVIIPGANLCMSVDDVTGRLNEYFANDTTLSTRVVLFQNEIDLETNRAALRHCQNRENLISIFNPAPYTSSCKDLVHECNLLCVNEVELQMMVRDFGVEEELTLSDDVAMCNACLTVFDLCISVFGEKSCRLQWILVTLGALGAVLVNHSTRRLERFLAPVVNAVDSVGAGDSFVGCLAACLAENIDMDHAIQMAIQCASFSVQSRGAQSSYAYRKDLR